MNDLILYHGSRGGIQGNIKPISRERCDFGKGFYMGNNINQVKSLIVDDVEPYYYELKVHLSKIPENKILVLNDMDWAYTVLYNRGKLEQIKETDFYKKYAQMMCDKEFIIGPITDDNMSQAINDFLRGRMTNKALLESIRYINYGIQYVAKTESACNMIEIVNEYELTFKESLQIATEKLNRRKNGISIVDKMIRQYNKHGSFFDEIVAKSIRQSKKQKNNQYKEAKYRLNDLLEKQMLNYGDLESIVKNAYQKTLLETDCFNLKIGDKFTIEKAISFINQFNEQIDELAIKKMSTQSYDIDKKHELVDTIIHTSPITVIKEKPYNYINKYIEKYITFFYPKPIIIKRPTNTSNKNHKRL